MKTSIPKKILVYISTAFLLNMPAIVKAQDSTGINELLQEFFIGETVYAQEKNEFQLTSKPSYWKTREGSERINIPLQFEYGITNRFQLELAMPYIFSHPKDGTQTNERGNLEAGFLYNILNGNKLFALSLALDIGFPTAKRIKGHDENQIEWEPSIIVAKQIGKIQVHASLVAELTKSESALRYNMATGIPFGDWVATLELNGTFKEKKTTYITPGVVWKGLDDFEFGLGVSKSSAEWGIIFMVTHEFSFTRRK